MPIVDQKIQIVVAVSIVCLALTETNAQERRTKQEILQTGTLIREAFAKGDIEKIKSFHHPDVIKALGYDKLLEGQEAVMEDIAQTLENVDLVFAENVVENLLIKEKVVIEQTRFSIRGTPKEDGEPFVFSGRTMVTYVRYDESPTGWATIREIIQPATQ